MYHILGQSHHTTHLSKGEAYHDSHVSVYVIEGPVAGVGGNLLLQRSRTGSLQPVGLILDQQGCVTSHECVPLYVPLYVERV